MVGPTISTNASNTNASTMLISDSLFTPLSTPATIDRVATEVMPRISTTMVTLPPGMPNR